MYIKELGGKRTIRKENSDCSLSWWSKLQCSWNVGV